MSGYALQRKDWKQLVADYPDMTRKLKLKIVSNYDRDIRRPLLKYKAKDFASLEQRADFASTVAIKDFGDN